MQISNLQDLVRVALEYGRITNRPIEFSGVLLYVLFDKLHTRRQLEMVQEWTREFVLPPRVNQVMERDAIRIEWEKKDEE